MSDKTFNEWWLSLPEGRRNVLIENKWMLAEAAYEAGQENLKKVRDAGVRIALEKFELKGRLHLVNEWADMATNGVQWLHNIKDGISTPDEALKEMSENLERILKLIESQRKQNRE